MSMFTPVNQVSLGADNRAPTTTQLAHPHPPTRHTVRHTRPRHSLTLTHTHTHTQTHNTNITHIPHLEQVRHTNIAVVRMKVKGKKYEIACYKNKVLNWRNKIETDIDEVVQTQMVFTNVGKGQVANKKDLDKCFGSTDHAEIVRRILDSGVLQVSDKEREMEYSNLFRDIAAQVAEKCVNPESNRPYTVGVIDRAMRETLHFAVNPSKSAKQQSLDVIRLLKRHMPITRAQMKVRVTFPAGKAQLDEFLAGPMVKLGVSGAVPVEARPGTVEFLVDPGSFRQLDEVVARGMAPPGVLEVLDLSVHEEGDSFIDQEAARKEQLQGVVGGMAAMRVGGSGGGEAKDDGVGGGQGRGGRGGGGGGGSGGSGGGGGGGGGKKKKKKKGNKGRRGRMQQEMDTDGHLVAPEALAEEVAPRRTVLAAAASAGSGAAGGAGGAAGAAGGAGGAAGGGGGGKFKCNKCAGSSFADSAEHRSHFKSEWHRYNLKLGLKSIPSITLDEYKEMAAEDVDDFFDELT